MSYGNIKVLPATFTSGATTTGGVQIGRAFSSYYLELPSACTFNLVVQGSSDGTNYKRIYHAPADNDAVVTNVEITSATAGANGAIVKLPVGMQYMKLEALTAVANGLSSGLNFICVD